MRDPIRDQMSAETYAAYSDQELINATKEANRRLIDLTLVLVQEWDMRVRNRCRALAQEVSALRYELARRDVPNPSGASASITVAGSPIVGTNAADMTNVNTSGGDYAEGEIKK